MPSYAQHQDPLTEIVAPPSKSGTISNALFSKRSRLHREQVDYVFRLLDLLEEKACRHFQVKAIDMVPMEKHREFTDLETYGLFIGAAYACGFVTRDGTTSNPLEKCQDNLTHSVAQLSLPELRQLMHFIVRKERWDDGYWSTVLEHLKNGVLQAVSQRFRTDESLYLDN